MFSLESEFHRTADWEIWVEFCISAWRKAFSDDLSLLLKPSMGRLRSTQVMEGDLLCSKSADLMLVISF